MNNTLIFLPFFYDFYYLYGASLLVEQGQNPYVVSNLQQVMESFGWPQDERVWGFPHPPWVFWMYLPLSLLSPLSASIVWLGVELLSFALIFRLLLKAQFFLFPKCSLQPEILFPLLITVLPVLKTIMFGQISFFLLIGLLLYFIKDCEGAYFKAGLALSLTFIKPHFLLPLVVAIFVRSLIKREPSVLLGAMVGFGIQNLITAIFCPQLYRQYFDYLPSLVQNAPSLNGATLAQLLAKLSDFPFYIVLASLGILYAVKMALSSQDRDLFRQTLVTRMIPVSLLVAPYAFSHELVLLLPALIPIFYLVGGFRPSVRLIICVINFGFSLFILTQTSYEPLAIIFPLGLFALYFSSIRRRLPLKYKST